MTTITRSTDAATTTPTLIMGYATTRESRNVVHDLIGGGIAVTLVPPRPRSGNLELFYPSEADAWAAMDLHSVAALFVLVDSDRPDVGMTYALGEGTIGVVLDPDTLEHWIVTIPYQEIEP